MASHLTITSSAAGTRPFAGQTAAAQQAPGEAGDALGIFAALLGNPTVEQTAKTAAEPDFGTVLTLGLDATFGDAEDEAPDTEVVSPGLDAAHAVIPVQPQAMVDFIDALAQVKASIDRGEVPDAELVARVDAKLAELADALGLDLTSVELPDNFADLLAGAEEAQTPLGDVLAQLLAPLTKTVQEAGAAAAASGPAQTGAIDNLKLLGAKLSALLSTVENGGAAPETLAQLGMPPGQPPASEVDEALSRFAALAQAEVPQEPELALPALKITEPVLAGKAADAPEAPEAPIPVAKPGEIAEAAPKPNERDDRPADQSPQRERVETRREPTNNAGFVAPAANEAAPADTQTATQQPATPRIDSAATTRLVAQPGYQTSQQQLNLPQIAFELARQVEGGNTRFQIRLDPPELGRIDVRLEIDNAGTVNARLTVEKAETLDLMQRDQRGLERALQQAGVDANKANLEFSLKQNTFAGQPGMGDGQKGQNAGNGTANDNGKPADDTPEPTPTVNLYRGTLQARGVNIIA